MSAQDSSVPQMSKGTLILACFVLAFTNFMVVLDTTIANVSVAHIAGGLGISSSEGTWVITSYAVAEAISGRSLQARGGWLQVGARPAREITA